MLCIKDKEFKKIVKDILRNSDFKKLANIEHHGISRWEHLVKIAYYSYIVSKKLNMDYVSITRGALLHDFYLDGNERSNKRKFLDTFTHPKRALETSNSIFDINDVEKNIIISHMFPFYLSIPKYKESILVNIIDKIIGGYEIFMEYKYKCNYKVNYLYLLMIFFMNN